MMRSSNVPLEGKSPYESLDEKIRASRTSHILVGCGVMGDMDPEDLGIDVAEFRKGIDSGVIC